MLAGATQGQCGDVVQHLQAHHAASRSEFRQCLWTFLRYIEYGQSSMGKCPKSWISLLSCWRLRCRGLKPVRRAVRWCWRWSSYANLLLCCIVSGHATIGAVCLYITKSFVGSSDKRAHFICLRPRRVLRICDKDVSKSFFKVQLQVKDVIGHQSVVLAGQIGMLPDDGTTQRNDPPARCDQPGKQINGLRSDWIFL
jgi:hypothetical protein